MVLRRRAKVGAMALLVMFALTATGCGSLRNLGKSVADPWLDPPDFYGDVEAEVVRVIDGDTIVVNIPGYPEVFGENISIRLSGVDAPEPHEPNGKEAKAYVESLLEPGDEIRLFNMRRDRFFRIISDIRIEPGMSLGEVLMQNGFATPDGTVKRVPAK